MRIIALQVELTKFGTINVTKILFRTLLLRVHVSLELGLQGCLSLIQVAHPLNSHLLRDNGGSKEKVKQLILILMDNKNGP